MITNDYQENDFLTSTPLACRFCLFGIIESFIKRSLSIYSKTYKNDYKPPPQVKLVYPQPGYVEIEPDDLFERILQVIKEAIKGPPTTSPKNT